MTARTLTEAPPIGFFTQLSYGIGGIQAGVALTGLAASTLQYYLNQVIGVAPLLSSTLILVSLAVDSVLDPVIGQWSDNLRSRWGRRHPFIYVAAVLLAVSFFLLWNAPKQLSAGELFAFMMVLLVAVRVSGSLYDIPSGALTPELAPDYDKRTTLLSYRWFFLIIGLAVIAYLLNAVFLRTDAQHPLGLLNRDGYARFGLFGGLLIFFTATASALGTHRRIPYLHIPPKRPFKLGATLREMAQVLTHPALIVVMLCGLFGGTAGGLRNALDNYFYTHFWGLQPQQIGVLLPLGVVGSAVAVVAAPFVSRWLGKKWTMIVFFASSLIVSLIPIVLKLMGLMPSNASPWVLAILAIDVMFVAVLGVAAFVIGSSMVSDVVEDNAVKTGLRSEGLLFAVNGLLPKFTGGIGAVMAGSLLTFVHFPNHAMQGTVPPALMRELALLFLPLYVVLLVFCVGVLFFYRIDRSAHERNLETIREAAALAALAEENPAVIPPF